MLTFRSVMAAVGRKAGGPVSKLCPLNINRVFSLISRPRVGVFEACFSLRIFEKNNEGFHGSGKQIRRTCCTFVLRVTGNQSAPVLTRSHSSSSHHTSKTAYYDVLRVSPHATQAQIKTAYYRQSFLYHPDRNAGSDEAARRFSEISEAYTVLGSAALRRKYDRGVLSLADLQSAGRPSRRDTRHPPSPDHYQQQQQQRRPRSDPVAVGKPVFDFDAFYRAHYGEQLEREQTLRRWREGRQQAQQHEVRKWKREKMAEIAISALLALGVVLFFSLKSS